ncbi:MAG TPA: Stp1/IreP family PP2C-type Ser/Thr phosphatase [Solirubrobacterales bacterium]|jgi:protein phosphatase|nr:Stp1/IreP family PP2C-type Ser/Thr phosphatase [Solirubrobacterales bacterium]
MLRVVEEAHRTDTGRQRHANEDALYAEAPVFAVADGMGGAQAGEVAARIAADAFDSADDRGEAPPEGYLRRVVRAANERIHDLAERDASRSGMGTTLTAALIGDDEVSFAHVGDSRAYVFRDGDLKRLTSDHSLVEELRRQGRLTEAQAEEHPQRSIITRALGPEPEVEVDTMTYSARPGDVFLLCSDGLTTMVPEARIARILGRARDLDSALSRLVREANEGGGRDNITVIAFRLDEEAVAAEEQPTMIGPAPEEAEVAAEAEAVPLERPAAPPRARARRWPRRLAGAAVVLLIVAGLGVAAVFGARQVYFLGVDEGGRMALYRGLPYELPFGIDLYDERYSSPVQFVSVPADVRSNVTDHELRSHDDAVSLIEEYEQRAAAAEAKGEKQPAGGRGKGGQGGRRKGGGESQGDRTAKKSGDR